MPRKPPIDRDGIGPFAVGTHREVVDLTECFVGIVDDVAANDLGRAIACGQRLHIDLD